MSEIFENRALFAWATGILFSACVAGIFAVRRSRGRESVSAFRFCEIFLAAIGWLLLTVALGERIAENGRVPFSNVFEIFQSLGWCALFSTLLLRVVWGLRVPAVSATGTASALCIIGFVDAQTWDISPVFTGTAVSASWIAVHVGFTTVGYACFSAAAMVWGLFLLQNSALRHRFTHRFFSKLPDLAALDRIGGRLCSAGLVFFGFGISVGTVVLFGDSYLGSRLAIYKISVSALIFCGFAYVQILRRKNKISGLKLARAGLGIFVAAIILLGGVACLRENPDEAPADVPAVLEDPQ